MRRLSVALDRRDALEWAYYEALTRYEAQRRALEQRLAGDVTRDPKLLGRVGRIDIEALDGLHGALGSLIAVLRELDGVRADIATSVRS